MKKQFKTLIIVVPLVILILIVFLLSIPKTIQFSDKKNSSKTFIESKGNSRIITESIDENKLYCKYKVGTEKHPRLGIGIRRNRENSFFRLKGYDYLELIINSDSSDNFNVCLLFDIPKFTLKQQWWSYLYKITEISVQAGKEKYRVPISELHTPFWWFDMNRISKDALSHKYNRNRCKAIVFTNHDLALKDFSQEINIQKILFKRDPLKIIYFSLISILLYSLYLFLILRKRKLIKTIPYEKIPIKSNNNLEISELDKYLGKNYHNSKLSLLLLSEETGIAVYRIRKILKSNYNRSFKQHITHLRISEAKRLLTETDRQIVEIAQCVGYNHVSTFNHNFKLETKKTPVEFRIHNNL